MWLTLKHIYLLILGLASESSVCSHINMFPGAAAITQLVHNIMKFITIIFVAYVVSCESQYIYSSFWAPLFDPKLLNYRVDAEFDPASGKNMQKWYERNHGYRGKTLIADLGNGVGPKDSAKTEHGYGDVNFYYTQGT